MRYQWQVCILLFIFVMACGKEVLPPEKTSEGITPQNDQEQQTWRSVPFTLPIDVIGEFPSDPQKVHFEIEGPQGQRTSWVNPLTGNEEPNVPNRFRNLVLHWFQGPGDYSLTVKVGAKTLPGVEKTHFFRVKDNIESLSGVVTLNLMPMDANQAVEKIWLRLVYPAIDGVVLKEKERVSKIESMQFEMENRSSHTLYGVGLHNRFDGYVEAKKNGEWEVISSSDYFCFSRAGQSPLAPGMTVVSTEGYFGSEMDFSPGRYRYSVHVSMIKPEHPMGFFFQKDLMNLDVYHHSVEFTIPQF